MRGMRARLLPLALLLAACASGGARPASIARPDINIVVRDTLYMDRSGTGPLTVEVHVHNAATQPVVVRRVRVQSWAMTEYAIYPAEKIVRETIAPGESRAIIVDATGYRKVSQRTLNEPLTLRALVDFEAAGEQFREIYTDNSVFE